MRRGLSYEQLEAMRETLKREASNDKYLEHAGIVAILDVLARWIDLRPSTPGEYCKQFADNMLDGYIVGIEDISERHGRIPLTEQQQRLLHRHLKGLIETIEALLVITYHGLTLAERKPEGIE